jgi:iron complex outermembrane receptor protein
MPVTSTFVVLSHRAGTLDKIFSREKVLMPFTDRTRTAAKRAAAAVISLVAVAAYAEESSSPETPAVQPAPPAAVESPTNSVAILTTGDLEERGIVSLDGIAAALPGIASTPAMNSLTTLSLYMRGEGPAAPGQITLDGAVGLYQDGFYVSRLQANTFDLLDLERAEVLAGPQGATYGRDTTGGVINLISQAPRGELRFDESVDFGNRNSYRVLSSIDTPRWYDLSAKVTVVASSIDGYVKNALATQQDFGEEQQRAARLQLLWDGLSNLRAEYFIERSGLDSTAEYDSNPAQNGEQIYAGFTYYADPKGPPQSTYRPVLLPLSTSNHTAQGLTLTWHALPALTVQSLTGYRTMTANEFQDYTEFYGEPVEAFDDYQQHQFSQDLRFSGEWLDRQIGYVAGASYFREKGAHADNVVVQFDSVYEEENELRQVSAEARSQAVYAQLQWRPAFTAGRLEVTAADRYTKDSQDAERFIIADSTEVVDPATPSHLSYNRATPEFSVAYRWSEAVSTYAKVATAYQAGGALESAPPGEFASDVFRPETSTTYELGLKATLNEHVRADFALFDSKRKNVQYVLPVNIVTDDAFELQRVTVEGASFDLHVMPFNDLTLGASATYLHWRIDQADAEAGTIFDPSTTSGASSPYTVGENIRGIFALPYTPKYSASVAGDYTFLHLDRRDVMMHLDYVYRSEMFAQGGAGPAVPGGQFDTQSAYGLLNGRITVSQETDWSHRLKFSLWGRNLLNRKYYQPAVGVGGGVMSFDTTSSPATLDGYQSRAGAWAEPLTYGLNITYAY